MNDHPDVLSQLARDQMAARRRAAGGRRLVRRNRADRAARARSGRWRRVSAVSHATVVAYAALFMATSGVAVAATGGTFVLGRSNSASTVTTLTNSAGPALSLRSPSGHAPLQVNRNVKVANLNADLLDGKDATTFATKAAFDALKSDHTALAGAHATLRSDVTALAARVTALEGQQADHAALADQVARLQALLAGVSREQVDGHDTVRFSGVNVQVVNGTDTTDRSPNGLGNLILGYNRQPGTVQTRTGSHYLVVGDAHQWTRSSGIVAGFANSATGTGASVLGGQANTAGGPYSSVSGGSGNRALGDGASVTGGEGNRALGYHAAVSGGRGNTADLYTNDGSDGFYCASPCGHTSVSGGVSNIARGPYASVTGGRGNLATGWTASVSGGSRNTASGEESSILGGSGRTATELASCHPACS